MNEQSMVTPRQKQTSLIAAGIFTALGFAFFLFLIYNVFVDQKGVFDPSDKFFFPMTIMMFVISLVSFRLIQKDRHTLGTGLLFFVVVLIPPAVLVLLLQGVLPVGLLYLVMMALLMILQVLPNATKRLATISAIVLLLALIGIEIWNPAFRITTNTGGFLIAVTAIGGLGLVAFLVRLAWRGNIRIKLITSFVVLASIAVASVAATGYFFFRDQLRKDISQRLLNIVSIAALQQDGDLHNQIQKDKDANSEAYRTIKARNMAIVATDPDIAYIYTMRQNDFGQIFFVVDSGQPGDDTTAALFDRYTDPSAFLAANFAKLDKPVVESEFYTDEFGTFLSAYAPFYTADGQKAGVVGADISSAAVLQIEQRLLLIIIIIGVVVLALLSVLYLFIGNLFTRPIISLSRAAEKIAAGDLDTRVFVDTEDELSTLAVSFNNMALQLQNTLQGLEGRIAERTESLELAAEVGRSVSQVRSLDVMLKDAAELIRSRFNLYYVQVYLTDAQQSSLVLKSGTGQVGEELLSRSHRLPLQTSSINGRAAIEKRSVVVADTAASPTFKANPLLPETRSEMAVPLLVGEKVVGVLDLQSSQPGALNKDVLSAFEALAGQLAIAIQNANFLAETQEARAEVEAQARRLTRANWSEYLDAVHAPEVMGFVYEGEQVKSITDSAMDLPVESENTLVAPITVTGEPLGNLVVEMEGESPITRTDELVQNVARQVAQQIENLRLLETAERARAEAEQASRRVTREGWKEYIEAKGGESRGYMYNLIDVQPVDPDVEQAVHETDLIMPLKVRNEAVGKLAVQGVSADDRQSLDLIGAVAERLGAHIESLRQQEQTQAALEQTESLSAASLRLAQAGDLQDMLKIIHETLGISSINRIVLGVFNYDAANEMEEMQIAANWWSGSGTEPTPVGQRYTAETLSDIAFFKNPTPLFASDAFNDERIQGTSLMVIKQQNIHSIGSMPLFISGRQTGVLILECEEYHYFAPAEIRLFSAMAPQVATVLENRMQYERAQKQAERQSTLNIISQKIQGATSVEAVLQIAARELGHALGAPRTIAQLSIKDKK